MFTALADALFGHRAPRGWDQIGKGSPWRESGYDPHKQHANFQTRWNKHTGLW